MGNICLREIFLCLVVGANDRVREVVMRHRSRAAFFFGSLILWVVSASPALADDLYGRIRGTIADPSGAVIPEPR